MCICSTYCLQFRLEKSVIFFCLESGDPVLLRFFTLFLRAVAHLFLSETLQVTWRLTWGRTAGTGRSAAAAVASPFRMRRHSENTFCTTAAWCRQLAVPTSVSCSAVWLTMMLLLTLLAVPWTIWHSVDLSSTEFFDLFIGTKTLWSV